MQTVRIPRDLFETKRPYQFGGMVYGNEESFVKRCKKQEQIF